MDRLHVRLFFNLLAGFPCGFVVIICCFTASVQDEAPYRLKQVLPCRNPLQKVFHAIVC